MCESEVVQSCPTLRDPMDCSLPGSSAHGIFQARILEWFAISFSRGTGESITSSWWFNQLNFCSEASKNPKGGASRLLNAWRAWDTDAWMERRSSTPFPHTLPFASFPSGCSCVVSTEKKKKYKKKRKNKKTKKEKVQPKSREVCFTWQTFWELKPRRQSLR